MDGFLGLAGSVWRTRAYGDFWSHVLVAEGAVDVSAEPEVSLWDLAALQVIVEEAGGTFTDLTGKPTPGRRQRGVHQRPPARRGARPPRGALAGGPAGPVRPPRAATDSPYGYCPAAARSRMLDAWLSQAHKQEGASDHERTRRDDRRGPDRRPGAHPARGLPPDVSATGGRGRRDRPRARRDRHPHRARHPGLGRRGRGSRTPSWSPITAPTTSCSPRPNGRSSRPRPRWSAETSATSWSSRITRSSGCCRCVTSCAAGRPRGARRRRPRARGRPGLTGPPVLITDPPPSRAGLWPSLRPGRHAAPDRARRHAAISWSSASTAGCGS